MDFWESIFIFASTNEDTEKKGLMHARRTIYSHKYVCSVVHFNHVNIVSSFE
jgi:hypothetical protein